jgi:small-conductance mechanosensitive channel
LVGLDLTALSVFGGALGVGIGLGLQRIASNYISGFIVLLERRVHLGDIVRVDQFSGQVKEIRTRFTVLRSGEGVDQIVPNELLTAQAVQNYSTSGTSIVKLPLLIAYSADVDLASQLALQSVQGVERVLEQPGASVFFRGWTIDGLLLELIFSISDPNKGSDPVRSEILQKIWLSWQAQGVPVPFMQRDFRPPVGQIVTSAPSANHALSTPVSGSDPSR